MWQIRIWSQNQHTGKKKKKKVVPGRPRYQRREELGESWGDAVLHAAGWESTLSWLSRLPGSLSTPASDTASSATLGSRSRFSPRLRGPRPFILAVSISWNARPQIFDDQLLPPVHCWHCLVAKSCLTLVTPWTVARQAPLSVRFGRQEY